MFDQSGTETRQGTTGNVVDISHFLTDRSFPEIAVVDAYWQALRGDRLMPARDEIDPRGIKSALSNCFVLERIAPAVSRFRLGGQLLNDLMGLDVCGAPFATLFTPHYRKAVHEMIEDVCKMPGLAQMALSAEQGVGKSAIEARLTLWPLKDELGHPSRILGCISIKGQIGVAPRQFHGTTNRLKRLGPVPSHQPAGLSEAAASFSPRNVTEPAARRDHLRLVAIAKV